MNNIVIITVDQLASCALRAYAHGAGTAPEYGTIDSFFRDGTFFDRAYTPCPLCMPARAAFWTSAWPHQTGVLSNGRKFEQGEVPESLPALGEAFAAAGWETIHFGKEHDAGALRGFERVPQGSREVDPEPGYPVNQDTFRDRATTDQAVAYFEARRGRSDGVRREPAQPLLAVIELNNPHNICGWVGEMARHVSGPDTDFIPPPAGEPTPAFPPGIGTDELPPLPPNFHDDDFETRPRSVQYQCCAHNRLAQTQGWGEREFRLYLDAYHHYTARADAEIARVLEAARSALPDDDTIYVFFADHGDAMTAHGGVTKHTTFYDETTRVPLAFVGPGIEPGRRVEGPVSLLDMAPTLLDLAGIGAGSEADEPEAARLLRASAQGRSLAPLLTGPPTAQVARGGAGAGGDEPRCVASEWHTEWGFTVEPGRMITDGRLKYMVYAEGGDEELYDLEADPFETRNLAPDPAAAGELDRMRSALEEHVRETDDPFPRLEHVASPRWRGHEPGYANHRGPAAPQV